MDRLCSQLHKIVHAKKRYYFQSNGKDIPSNGIYVLFENGESGHGLDRIVRIGTHTGQEQLRSRLKQHFLKENKDRSIFRKNIGRSILNKSNDPYLNLWEHDCTSSAAKLKFGPLINYEYQLKIEKEVSEYIQQHFSFCVLEVQRKEDRMYLESRLISTVSGCSECGPSNTWLGLSSPKDKIRLSGLWQVNELYKDPLKPNDFARLGV